MDNKKNNIQNFSSNPNSIKNSNHNHIVYNSNQINNHYPSKAKFETNQNKFLSLKTNFKPDSRSIPSLKSFHSNDLNIPYKNKEKIHENIAKKYYNNRNTSLKEMNQDSKSNYSFQSNSSSRTIKSMIDLINTGAKSKDEFSFQEIKCKNYPVDLNSSKLSQDGKYVSTNYSLNRDIKHNYHKDLPKQTKGNNDPQMNLVIKQKIENAKINEIGRASCRERV